MHNWTALEAVNLELEPLLEETGFLDDAPFSWVTLTLFVVPSEPRPNPRCFPIDKTYGDLPLEIELDGAELRGKTAEELIIRFRLATVRALIHGGKKHHRSVEEFERLLDHHNSHPFLK